MPKIDDMEPKRGAVAYEENCCQRAERLAGRIHYTNVGREQRVFNLPICCGKPQQSGGRLRNVWGGDRFDGGFAWARIVASGQDGGNPADQKRKYWLQDCTALR